MKRNFLLTSFLILTLIFNLKAQVLINNFDPSDNQIIWQKVYTTTLNFKQLTDNINSSGLFTNLNIEENTITGHIKNIDADFKGAGYSEMATPMYISRSFIDGFISIDFKDGKYRVTLKNIFLNQKYNDALTKQGEKSTLETWSLKKGKNEFKDAFTKSPSKILDYTFSRKFDFTTNKDTKNW